MYVQCLFNFPKSCLSWIKWLEASSVVGRCTVYGGRRSDIEQAAEGSQFIVFMVETHKTDVGGLRYLCQNVNLLTKTWNNFIYNLYISYIIIYHFNSFSCLYKMCKSKYELEGWCEKLIALQWPRLSVFLCWDNRGQLCPNLDYQHLRLFPSVRIRR